MYIILYQDLIVKMNQEEAAEREQREMERSTCRIKLFCQPPGHSQMVEKKLRVHKDSTLKETTKLAYKVCTARGSDYHLLGHTWSFLSNSYIALPLRLPLCFQKLDNFFLKVTIDAR